MTHASRPSRRLAVAACSAVLAAAALVAPPASAAAGALDLTFSSDGRVVSDVAGCEDSGSAVAQQSDGKLLVAGSGCVVDGYRALLQRYTAAGALDSTFSGDGSVLTADDGEFFAVEQASDGTIVAGGVRAAGAADALVARYSATGVQEMLFSHHIGAPDASASVDDVSVAADGKITAAGTTCDDDGTEFTCRLFVMKVTAAGALDPTFDSDGVALSAGGLYGEAALLPDGRLAFAGFDEAAGPEASVVRLFTAALAPDTSFNTAGSRTMTFNAYGITPTASGLLVSGEQFDEATEQGDIAVAMLDLAGAMSPSFGTAGVAVHDLGRIERATDAAVDATGNVYVSGEHDATDGGFLLARLKPSGALDPAFGEGGSTQTTFGEGGYSWAAALTVQSDGKPVLAGAAETATGSYDVALARYQASTPFEIRYTPIAPARILETRPISAIPDGIDRPLGRTERFDMQVTGRGGVPATGVSAVVLNVTAIKPTAGGYLSAFPTGTSRPAASNLNFVAGQIVPNLVTVKLGDGGKVSLFNGSAGQTDVAVDVSGWYSDGNAPVAGGSYVPVSPSRVVDSRAGRAPAGDGLDVPIGRTGTVEVTVGGRGGVPLADVSAVVLNMTVTAPTAGGYLTVFPGASARPTASHLNFSTGQTVANLVIVGVSDAGKVALFNGSAGTTHVLVDVAGYFTKAGSSLVRGSFQGLTPSRVLDTRPGGGAPEVALAPFQTITVQIAGRGRVPATGVSAVALNVTAVSPTSGGFLTVYPADAATRPGVSNVNFAAGQTVPNAVIVKLSPGGAVKLFNAQGSTHVLFDVAGWYDAAIVD